MDSDDSIDPSYYEKLHQAAVQSGAEIAIGDILYFEADGSLSGYQEKALRTEVISGDEAIPPDAAHTIYPPDDSSASSGTF